MRPAHASRTSWRSTFPIGAGQHAADRAHAGLARLRREAAEVGAVVGDDHLHLRRRPEPARATAPVSAGPPGVRHRRASPRQSAKLSPWSTRCIPTSGANASVAGPESFLGSALKMGWDPGPDPRRHRVHLRPDADRPRAGAGGSLPPRRTSPATARASPSADPRRRSGCRAPASGPRRAAWSSRTSSSSAAGASSASASRARSIRRCTSAISCSSPRPCATTGSASTTSNRRATRRLRPR